MKRVLIADDEFLVRIGLKSTIPWEENGFVVVGEAKNGREAIELFEQYDPDILLTDIRMPIMNGLELIQELKTRKSSLKAVILTHYDDFNYAKEAIKLGASEYILKSDLSKDTLLSVLNKLSYEMENADKSDADNNKQADMENTSDVDYAGMLFKNIVMGNYQSKQELDQLWNKIKNVFNQGLYIVGAAKVFVNDFNEAVLGFKEQSMRKSIEDISNQVFAENYITHIFVLNNCEMFYLFHIKELQDPKNALERVKNLVALLKKNIAQFLDLDISVGLSGVHENYEKVLQLLEEAKLALNYCFFEQSGVFAFHKAVKSYEDECPKIHLDTLKNCIKTFDKNHMENYFIHIFEELDKMRNSTYVREIFIDFLSYAKIIASELNLKNHPAFNDQKLSYRNFEKLHNFEMVKKYITDLYDELMYQTGENKQVKYSFVISKCIDYIRNNYFKNISLADAADYVQISKSYLSLLFKQETGVNFSSFLTNYRIEKSKKLLRESNYKIYEIAEKVGFDNPYYFSKVFKELTGISCKEFKKVSS